MAHDATVAILSFEFWLRKAVEWGQTTTLESQQDVCLHLPKLQEFLLQIYENLKHMNTTAAIQKFPLIGQLLGRLCWNPFIVGYDECQKILMWCLSCLYSSEPQTPVELKANSWIRSLLCHMLSSFELGSKEADTSTFISTLGFTSADYYSKLIKNLKHLTAFSSSQISNVLCSCSFSSDRAKAISLLCVPLITLPDVSPLVEILSSLFLETANGAFLQKKIALSEAAILELWLRHLSSMEKAVLCLFERLISSQSSSLEEVVAIVKDSLLVCIAISHVLILYVITVPFTRNALLETDGTPEVMTIIQMFTQCFVQAYQKDNKQHKFPLKAYFPHHDQSLVMALLKPPVGKSYSDLFENWFLLIRFGEWADIAAEQLLVSEAESSDALLWLLAFYYNPHNSHQQRTQTTVGARALYDHLTMLFSCTTLSVTDLQAAVSSKIELSQPCTKHLLRHLLVCFLLFAPAGHRIARECIAYLTLTGNEKSEVSGLLTRTAYRLNHLGLKSQKTVSLVNELLQDLKIRV
uniref:FA complementation group C n=1 Tax=Sphenodon punctatus TaxID=8508 RepID=A0A8D0L391_SPHPU